MKKSRRKGITLFEIILIVVMFLVVFACCLRYSESDQTVSRGDIERRSSSDDSSDVDIGVKFYNLEEKSKVEEVVTDSGESVNTNKEGWDVETKVRVTFK